MSVLPGAPVTPRTFGQTAVLYSAVEDCSAVVDGAPPTVTDGHRGRLFIVKAGKPTRVPEEAARFMLDHYGYTGVVRVRETPTSDGIHYELKEAHQESLDKLAQADEVIFRNWLSGIIEDYVKRSKPVPVPDERMAKLIARRHYNLKDYGIVPIGFAEKQHDAEMEKRDAEIAQLKAQLESLKASLGEK